MMVPRGKFRSQEAPAVKSGTGTLSVEDAPTNKTGPEMLRSQSAPSRSSTFLESNSALAVRVPEWPKRKPHAVTDGASSRSLFESTKNVLFSATTVSGQDGEQQALANPVNAEDFGVLCDGAGLSGRVSGVKQSLLEIENYINQSVINCEGKTSVLVMGTTGCGKSTTINYLSGCEMQETEDDLGQCTVNALNPVCELGHTSTSHTLLPQVVRWKEPQTPETLLTSPDSSLLKGANQIDATGVAAECARLLESGEITRSEHDKFVFKTQQVTMPKSELTMPICGRKKLLLCDLPGFLETRGREVGIANAINNHRIMSSTAAIQLLLLIEFSTLTSTRARGVTDVRDLLIQLFGTQEELTKHAPSILIGVTKVDAKVPVEKLKVWLLYSMHVSCCIRPN